LIHYQKSEIALRKHKTETKEGLKGKATRVYKNEDSGDLYNNLFSKIPNLTPSAKKKELFQEPFKLHQKYPGAANELILSEEFCTHYKIHFPFINNLNY